MYCKPLIKKIELERRREEEKEKQRWQDDGETLDVDIIAWNLTWFASIGDNTSGNLRDTTIISITV